MSIFSLVFFFWCDIHGLIMPSVQTGVNLTNEETGVYTVPAFILSVVLTYLAKLTFCMWFSGITFGGDHTALPRRFSVCHFNSMDNGGTYFDFFSLWFMND